MTIHAICSTCQNKLAARDELQGKRVKCPRCGGLTSLPSAMEPEPAEAVPDGNERPSPADSRGKRRRKRRSSKSREAAPVFIALGIEFTPAKLFAAGGSLVMMGILIWILFAFTPLGDRFSSKPRVRVVDVYTAVNGFSFTDLGTRVLQKKSSTYTIPGHRKLLITREHAGGSHLLVTVRVPNSEVARYFKDTRGPIFIRRTHIHLQAGDENIEPFYVTDHNEAVEGAYDFGFAPPRTDGPPTPLRDYLGPRDKAWTHDGETTQDGDVLRFKGQHGMQVNIQTGAERMDGQKDHTPMSDLTGYEAGKGLDATPLIGGPTAYVHVTWDKDSIGWLCANEVEQPNDISLSWEISCIFPRPKTAGKEMTLWILDKAQVVRVP